MDDIYGVFKGHVVAVRGQKLKKPIDDLAGGRVYTGLQALDLGRVGTGSATLHDAIKEAAEQAKIEKYEVRARFPEPEKLHPDLARGVRWARMTTMPTVFHCLGDLPLRSFPLLAGGRTALTCASWMASGCTGGS